VDGGGEFEERLLNMPPDFSEWTAWCWVVAGVFLLRENMPELRCSGWWVVVVVMVWGGGVFLLPKRPILMIFRED